MKLGWDNDQCVFALAPAAWGSGKNFNTGNFPSYPNGAYQNMVMTNFGTNQGYVYRPYGKSCLQFDGTDSNIVTQYDILFTNTNEHTVEVKLNYNHTGAQQIVLGQYQDGTSSVQFYTTTGGRPAMYHLFAGVLERATAGDGNGLLRSQDNTVHFVKKGGTLSLYLNGYEVSNYANRDTYNQGNQNLANTAKVGVLNVNTNPSASCMYWIAFYEKALSASQILTHANLPNDMGLRGYNDDNTMYLSQKAEASVIGTGL